MSISNLFIKNDYDLYTNTLQITSSIDSIDTQTGCIIISGGCGIAKKINIGGITKIYDSTNSSNTSSGSLIVSGGASIAKDLYVGGSIFSTLSPIPQEPATFNLTFSGPWATPQTVTCKVLLIGSIINIYVPGIAVAGTHDTYISSGAVPISYRPSVTISFTVNTFDVDNTTADRSIGFGFMPSSGTITIYKNPATNGFDVGNQVGFYSFVIQFTN